MNLKPFYFTCLLITFVFAGNLRAQEETETAPESTATTEQSVENEEESATTEDEPEISVFNRINGVFEEIVGVMASGLFYKIFTKEEYYVVVEAVNENELHLNGEYIWSADKELYLKNTGKRGILSESETLSVKEIANLGIAGSIQTVNGNFIQARTTGGAPIVVLWLACGSIIFTIYMGGFNIWGFRHALEIVRGKYDNPDETGEVTHFQALSSALSATVGLGNIGGVTIAMTLGGPGAFFWMIFCGFFGMCSKFVECTLGQKYRTVEPDGTILGGPMRYLKVGLEEIGLKPLGIVLSLLFAVMCILASFGGGNMYQANQSGAVVLATLQEADQDKLNNINVELAQAETDNNQSQINALTQQKEKLSEKMASFETWFRAGYGVVLAFFVGVVIIGGIRRIGATAEKIVPTMCGIYLLACLYIIFSHPTELPGLIASIFTEAFNPQAMGGGLIGVLVIGVQRAAFSNEAGVGSAAIAHSAAKTEEPIREGSVALLGPFIDTIIICSMTALVILITGAWDNEQWLETEGLEGAALASRAFGNEVEYFPWVLSFAVIMFAYSTIISWSYYGERCWALLFGLRSTIVYKFLAVCCVFLGAIFHLGAVLDFSDMMILSMAFPNILGAILLAPKVKRDLADYWRRYKAGEFQTYK